MKNLAKNFTARCPCHLPAGTRASFGGQVRCGGWRGTRNLGPEDLGSRLAAVCSHPGPAVKEKQGDWRETGTDGAGTGTRGGTRLGAGRQVDRLDDPGRGTQRCGQTSRSLGERTACLEVDDQSRDVGTPHNERETERGEERRLGAWLFGVLECVSVSPFRVSGRRGHTGKVCVRLFVELVCLLVCVRPRLPECLWAGRVVMLWMGFVE